MTNLDFTCVPGDMILVRTRAMRTGHSPLSDNRKYKKGEWNTLGDGDYASWNDVSDAHLTPCAVIAVVEMPDDVSNLDHLVLLAANGIAYVFNDPRNGFWIPIEQEVSERARPFPRMDSGPHGRPAPRSVVEATERRREALRPTPRAARRESQSAWYNEVHTNKNLFRTSVERVPGREHELGNGRQAHVTAGSRAALATSRGCTEHASQSPCACGVGPESARQRPAEMAESLRVWSERPLHRSRPGDESAESLRVWSERSTWHVLRGRERRVPASLRAWREQPLFGDHVNEQRRVPARVK